MQRSGKAAERRAEREIACVGQQTLAAEERASGVTGPDTEPEERVSMQSAELGVFHTAIQHVFLSFSPLQPG